MVTQTEKALAFGALHARDRAFFIPNPWDLGSAAMFVKMGFEALATTSAGFAFTLGKRDGDVEREKMLAHAATIAASTDLPVSADLENGYADDPAAVFQTVRLAAEAGLAGCSIEDVPLGGHGGPYPIDFAAERVRAAAEASRGLRFPFALTARAENFLHDRPDLADTIARLQAYQEAGADVLYAPGLTRMEDIRSVVQSVDRPVNVLAFRGLHLNAAQLSAIGVKRISLGSTLARTAYGAAFQACREMEQHGTFSFMNDERENPSLGGML
ncbi:MAG: isocitrate lyase/phosphoenolpyruvate mutase family protein [Candidatus Eremiobacteraeota bacterium]|nr:isocitrate lyase/phosphoenolpyruvate mutase family protein [Candidatus Eremiobacteraeota bacterium]